MSTIWVAVSIVHILLLLLSGGVHSHFKWDGCCHKCVWNLFQITAVQTANIIYIMLRFYGDIIKRKLPGLMDHGIVDDNRYDL